MTFTPCLIGLTFLIATVSGIGWEDKVGPLENKVLDVPEGTEEPYPIYQFKSANPEVTAYQLTGDTDGKIKVSNEGWLYLERALSWAERQHHILQIEAVAESGIVDGPYSVTINVIDINNNRPTFNATDYSGVLKERTASGVPFMRVFATDLDDPDTPNAKLSYSILSQIPDPIKKPLFQINNLGEISTTPEGERHVKAKAHIVYGREDGLDSQDTLKRKFDEYCSPTKEIPYEFNPFYTCVERSESQRMNPSENPDYTLIVKVEDLEGKSENAFSANARVNIVVKQNLWFAPKTIEVEENHEGPYPMEIARVESNEPGAFYSLTQKERYPNFPFKINEEGVIMLINALDREEKDMYILVVFAKNNQDVELEKPLEIQVLVKDVNDNPPVCQKPESEFEVQENEEIGSVIGVLQVYDLDEENSPNTLLRYSIISQEPNKPSADMFIIDTYSGKIQLAKGPLRRKEVPQYSVIVTVSDKDGQASGYSTQCKAVIKVIDINNEVPVFEKNNYGDVTVSEDAEVGTSLLTVMATDADDPGTGSSRVLYHIIDGDPQGVFTIKSDETSNEGRLYIVKPLDFETTSVYMLTINARNPEPLAKGTDYDERSTANVSIQVTNIDEPPEFSSDIYEVLIKENITVGTTIIDMKAIDPEGNDLRYKLEGDEKNWLVINTETGEIKSKARLDREEVEEYKVLVTAFEKDSPEQATQKEVTIRLEDVNDNIPKLTESRSFVCVKNPEPVILQATDGDGPPFGQPFTFSVSKKVANWEIKPIDGLSAKLVLKNAPKEDKTFNIPVTVKDNAGMGVPQLFEVRVCNCTQLGYCFVEPVSPHKFKLGVSGTVGILAGTLGFVGLVLIIAFHQSKKTNKKKALEGIETDTMLQRM